jgi:predicted metal-dependent peptidase
MLCRLGREPERAFIVTRLHRPLKVSGDISAIPLEGGGGTDFRPFFEMLAEGRDPAQTLCVFLTDGFGVFPEKAPSVPVLWVVTESGLDEHRFPFGEVVRL